MYGKCHARAGKDLRTKERSNEGMASRSEARAIAPGMRGRNGWGQGL